MRKRISVYFRLFNIKFKKHIGLWWLLAICFLLFDLMLFISRFFADKPNEFGDSAGAVNGLFSAFAFAGVVYAIFLQKNELELQREELIQTREELKGQKHEFEQQNETLKRQRFENTFFNMLQLQQEITTSLYYKCPDGADPFEASGRQVFQSFYCHKKYFDQMGSRGLQQLIHNHDVQYYKDSTDIHVFDHYFRHLYRIVKYVDTTNLIPNKDKYDYICIIRATLSPYELLMIFYNCLSPAGIDKFKPLIECYTLFNNLRVELLAKPMDKDMYASTAYERKEIS